MPSGVGEVTTSTSSVTFLKFLQTTSCAYVVSVSTGKLLTSVIRRKAAESYFVMHIWFAREAFKLTSGVLLSSTQRERHTRLPLLNVS